MHVLVLIMAALTGWPDAVAAGTYHYTFDGTFWNGAKRSFVSEQKLQRSGSDVLLRVTPDSEEERDARPAERAVFDDVALALGNASTASAPGASWKAQLAVQSGQGADETTPVSLEMRVARSDASGTLLQGTGIAHPVLRTGQFSSPTDITVRVAALIRDGVVVRFDEDVTEFVHAQALSQEMHWRWTLIRTG